MKSGIFTTVLSINLLAVLSTAQDKAVGPSPQMPEHQVRNAKQVIEYEIAGLRPGRDTIEKAYHRFGKSLGQLSFPGSAISPRSADWEDPCNHQFLTVAFDTEGIIQDVTIHPAFMSNTDCAPKSYTRHVRARMGGTGHGLVYRDRCDRVQQIYGSPQSEGRSTEGATEFESFVYRFERVVKGPMRITKAPMLTLEVTCDSALKEVRAIKLTAVVLAASRTQSRTPKRKPTQATPTDGLHGMLFTEY